MRRSLSVFTLFTLLLLISFCFPKKIYASTIPEKYPSGHAGAYAINSITGEKLILPANSKLIDYSVNRISDKVEIITQTTETEIHIPSGIKKAAGTISESDSTGSYKATMKITYAKYYDTGWKTNMYLLQSYSGSWKRLDKHVSISNKKIAYGCSGFRPNVTQAGSKSIAGMSFSGNTGFKKYISDNCPGNICGASMSAKLKRAGNTSKWTFILENNAVSNGYSWSF